MSEEEHKLLKHLLDNLVKKHRFADKTYNCPECGGQVDVRFEMYSRRGRKMLGVQAFCNGCGATIAADYTESFPGEFLV